MFPQIIIFLGGCRYKLFSRASRARRPLLILSHAQPSPAIRCLRSQSAIRDSAFTQSYLPLSPHSTEGPPA
ncbi:hypothetical protein PsYK624_024050 [Phanerochaete sordida]|uniref:Uncharacterized protein n=1 Tax=Phanerochaete sordida TaxID=48140 RepID=A0A9P3G275_9APHY|nr:hypothetical protein PsYK624_024050 [Phanerochaete sordida]